MVDFRVPGVITASPLRCQGEVRAEVREVRLLLATVLALGVLVLTPPLPASADEPVPKVSIKLGSISPALPERDGTVTFAGRVTNITEDRLFRLQALLWRDQAPITDAEGLAQALDSASNEPIGRRYTNDGFQNLYQPADPYLDPGESATFTVTAKINDLELSPTDGVYLMGVHVLESGKRFAVGRARVFVPVLTDEPKNSLLMTSVVILNSRPSLVRPGVLADDHLAREIAEGGRLHALLAAADQNQMSYAVDPGLIEEIETMKAGYKVADGDGATTSGVGQSAASNWLNGFAALSDRDGFRLLYGSPDIAALVHSRQTQILTGSEAAAKTVRTTASLPLLILPGDGMADAATVEAAEALEPAAILLSDASARGSGPLLQGPGTAPIVTYSAAAFSGGPGPDPRNTAVHLQQRALADSWIEASSAAADSTLGRVRMITDAAQAQGDDVGVKTPWMKRTTLSALLKSKPDAWNQKFRYPDQAAATELTPPQLGSVKRLARSYAIYTDLLAAPDAVRATANATLARATSVGWRGAAAESSAFLAAPQRELDAILRDGLKITANPRVTTTSSRGFFPITVRNTLPAATDPEQAAVNTARVRLQFTSSNNQRLTVQRLDVPLLSAADNFTGNAQVDARSNGTVRVTAQLVTVSGDKVGRPFTIDVNATQAGRTGWFIAIAAGLVLVGSTALRIRQVARERAKAAPVTAPAAMSSAPPRPGDQTSQETLDV